MRPKKFRKKPVEVEAVRFTQESKDICFNFVRGNKVADWGDSDPGGEKEPILVIETLEGRMVAKIGDWIIKGTQGEFYPCKNDAFVACYEET